MEIRHRRRRLVYFLLFLTLIFAEILLLFFLPPCLLGAWGVSLFFIPMLCCFIRCLQPMGTQFLVFYAFFFASFLELGQYCNAWFIVNMPRLTRMLPLFTGVFSVSDLICYGIGAGVFFVFENKILVGVFHRRHEKF